MRGGERWERGEREKAGSLLFLFEGREVEVGESSVLLLRVKDSKERRVSVVGVLWIVLIVWWVRISKEGRVDDGEQDWLFRPSSFGRVGGNIGVVLFSFVGGGRG